MLSGRSPSASRAESWKVYPRAVAERLQALTYGERAVAYLQVDAGLTLVGAGGHLEAYGLAGLRLGEPAAEQAFFLEGLLPLVETPYVVPSIELASGRVADLHFFLRRRDVLGGAARRLGRARCGAAHAAESL